MFPPIAYDGEQTGRAIHNEYSSCCGILEWTRDEENNKTYYGYDKLGRTTKTYSDITGQSGTYPVVEYVYDDTDFGRLDQVKTRSAQGVVRTTEYTYDDAGRQTQIDYPDDLVGPEQLLYDEFGRLRIRKVLKDATPDPDVCLLTAYEYDDFNRVSAVDYEYSEFAYPFSAFSADVTYGYDDPSGRLESISGTVNGESVGATYGYDRQGKLTDYTPAAPSGYGTISYEYNELGQKTKMTVPLGVGNLGRRMEYAYDNTGRQFGMDVIPCSVTSEVTPPQNAGGSTTRFYYNDDQNRTRLITSSGNVYYFVYDPTASIPAVVYEQGPTNRYLNVRGPDGSLVTRETYNSDGIRTMSRTYHFDGLGSTMALTNESGTVTDSYTYDAWGNLTSHTGSTSDNPYQYVGQLGYYTHYQEPSFGLLQLGVRYYDPALGRFASRDPAKDGINWIAYVSGRPTALVDPRGMFGLGPGTWDMLRKLYPNWFRYYDHGTGYPRSLVEIGVSNLFWSSAQVQAALTSFHKDLSHFVGDVVRRNHRSVCADAFGGRAYLPGAILRKEKSLNFWSNGWLPFELTPLFPLGRSNVAFEAGCNIELDCCKRTYKFGCDIIGNMWDAFEDVNDIAIPHVPGFDRHTPGNQELPGGVAYDIYDSHSGWSFRSRGRF